MTRLLLSHGKTELVLSTDARTVVKFFHPTVSRERVEREVAQTRRAKDYGIRVPDIYDVIQQGDRFGVVMEYIQGPTMTDILSKAPYRIHAYARQLARIQAEINAVDVSGFTEQSSLMRTAILQTKARLGEEGSAHIVRLFDQLPQANRLCHNDLHQENLIFTRTGPVVLDWAEATVGHPIADVVHTLLIQKHPVQAPVLQNSSLYHRLHNAYRRYFARIFLNEYLRLSGLDREAIDPWLLPVAATRLFTKIEPEEKDWTEHYIRGELLTNYSYKR
ncbi:bifunctional UGMP family protein/serine/threonine protein kinase [Vibrio ruber DSM 16370]|uniref:Bifunctional UGMP family protein/serine/threonine protein kinase n=1 Tax=Vibrio ruber (strain DSM 16370 / JCM 11486 / BCRC 17186 / CECT 7878 / LMG 23124 / VR1) TaxID=1123498 RepID=A0A1R4LEE0_VIBR1|nr:aminoglycoside phosphotransferase family protein [Vibrio ruber]SJN54910.1 bifunctional UGMP family protein/serine/threonine protein kinase [Vibrio ruber DSM 16370]